LLMLRAWAYDTIAVFENLARRTGAANASIAVGSLARLAEQRANSLVDPAHRFEDIEREVIIGHPEGGKLGEVAQGGASPSAEFSVSRTFKATNAFEFYLQEPRHFTPVDRLGRRRVTRHQ